ncbi:thiamine phosphate synthase [Tenacibaculum sp. S7007]|uniref:Thiamine phosphate synthase n=1 Tax=Tenacibaculum pelagium TaxID=2759527 RepID=A0A839AM82_9FLAO|nr:thiamine phosphate synthase [Tenacibaculum pelagium]MBA6155556.1 thiamine phosphate synthase [Tenacibaculum pelagium]
MISRLQYISQGKTSEEHLENIQRACASGIEWVQLRIKKTNPKTFLETAKKAREITNHYQTRLIINDNYKIVKEINADGVYLEESKDSPLKIRKHLGKFYSIGAIANTLEDCKSLIDKNVDYITLGPFTQNEKGSKQSLEVVVYQVLIETLQTAIPIIAFGGVTLNNINELINTGIYGAAVSEEITRDFSTIPVYHQILKAPSTNEQRYSFDNK